MAQPRIVILGAGYGGLAFLKAWRRNPEAPEASVTLVDRNPFHTLKTLLHRVAVGELDESAVQLPLRSPLGSRLLVGEVREIDRARRRVRVGDQTLEWDYLVLALGSRANYFGIPGAEEFGLPLWDLDSARRLRKRLGAMQEERSGSSPSGRKGVEAPVAVAGAGFTGIEIGAELAARGIPVMLLEALSRLAPGFSSRTAEWLTEHLSRLGVRLRLDSPIAAVSDSEIRLRGGGTVSYRVLVWSTGIAGHPLYQSLGLPQDPSGRIVIGPDLRPEGEERIFVVGDAGRSALPPTAQTAELQGERAALNLMRILQDRNPLTTPLHLRGILVTVGRRKGFGQLGRTEFRGVLPFVLKRAVDAVYAREVRSLSRRGTARISAGR